MNVIREKIVHVCSDNDQWNVWSILRKNLNIKNLAMLFIRKYIFLFIFIKVHSAGTTTELPHHISSDEEIDELMIKFENLLKVLPRPNMVTIARFAFSLLARLNKK